MHEVVDAAQAYTSEVGAVASYLIGPGPTNARSIGVVFADQQEHEFRIESEDAFEQIWGRYNSGGTIDVLELLYSSNNNAPVVWGAGIKLVSAIASSKDIKTRGDIYRALSHIPDDEPLWAVHLSQSLGAPHPVETPLAIPSGVVLEDFCTTGVGTGPGGTAPRVVGDYAFRPWDPSDPIYTDKDESAPYTGHLRGNTGSVLYGMLCGLLEERRLKQGYGTQVYWSGQGLLNEFNPLQPGREGWDEFYARMKEAQAALAALPKPGPQFPHVLILSPGFGDEHDSPSVWAEWMFKIVSYMRHPDVALIGPDTLVVGPTYPEYLDDGGQDVIAPAQITQRPWLNYKWAAEVQPNTLFCVSADGLDVYDANHWGGNKQFDSYGYRIAHAIKSGANHAPALPGSFAPVRAMAFGQVYGQHSAATDTPVQGGLEGNWATNTAFTEIYFGHQMFSGGFGVAVTEWTDLMQLEVNSVHPDRIRIEDAGDDSVYVEFDIVSIQSWDSSSLPATSGLFGNSFQKLSIGNRNPQGGWTDVVDRVCKIRPMRYHPTAGYVDRKFYTAEKRGKISVPESLAHEYLTQDYTDWFVADIPPNVTITKPACFEYRVDAEGNTIRGDESYRELEFTTTDSTAISILGNGVIPASYAFEYTIELIMTRHVADLGVAVDADVGLIHMVKEAIIDKKATENGHEEILKDVTTLHNAGAPTIMAGLFANGLFGVFLVPPNEDEWVGLLKLTARTLPYAD